MAIGLASVGTSLGGFIMPLVVTYLIADYGWRHTNLILAAAVIVTVIPIVWVIIRNTPQEKGITPESGFETSYSIGPSSRKISTMTIINRRAFWVPVVAFVPMMTAFGAIQQNFAPYAADLQVGLQATSYLVSTMAIVMVLGKIFFGMMADKLDHRILYGLAVTVLLATLVFMTTLPT